MKTNEELRKFILAPVMRGIDAEEPLEYLTEIRQVVILFINCKVEGNLKASIGLDVSNEVYTSVCEWEYFIVFVNLLKISFLALLRRVMDV